MSEFSHEPCCVACDGKGATRSGPCADCLGTGHTHLPDIPSRLTAEFNWDALGVGEDGLPVHLPISHNEQCQGPTEPDLPHHLACWCGQDCPLNQALYEAFSAGQRTRRLAEHIQWVNDTYHEYIELGLIE